MIAQHIVHVHCDCGSHPLKHSTSWSRLKLLPIHCRSVKKYGKPVMMPSSDSVDESDAGNGSEGEGAFPASYQAPLAGLMSKGKLSFVGSFH